MNNRLLDMYIITKGKLDSRNSLIVVLPLPPKELSPNARCHWGAKAREVKRYRRMAWAEAIAARGRTGDRWKNATCQAKFYFATRRRRDRDNLLAALKAAFDGLTDSHILEDDSGLVHLPVDVLSDPENPRVELHLAKLEQRVLPGDKNTEDANGNYRES